MIVMSTEVADACGLDDVVLYDGDVIPAGIERASFYVPPYMAGPQAFEIMREMPALQVCQLPTAGYDHALPFLPAGATLCNAAGVHDASTAELVVGLILASLRRIDDFARAMPDGRWSAARYDSLADRRVIVVGHGGVGRAIAARLAPFECEIVPVARSARAGVHGIAELPGLLPDADIVVLAVPLEASTRGLADTAFLARMKDGALLVNAARGPVVDTEAMVAEVGRLRFAMDVTDPEPLPPGHALWRAPGVLISPHVGGNSAAFLPRIARLVAAQIARWESGEPLAHVIVS